MVRAARAGMVVVDHSTISPEATRGFAAELAEAGATLLDAPVSGGDVGARAGTLSIMVGGPAEAFGRVRPLLGLMGKTVTHCGPVGAGQLTKLVNQVLVSVTNLAVCEAMTLAVAGGLDPATTIAAVAGRGGGVVAVGEPGAEDDRRRLRAGVHGRLAGQGPAAGAGGGGRGGGGAGDRAGGWRSCSNGCGRRAGDGTGRRRCSTSSGPVADQRAG